MSWRRFDRAAPTYERWYATPGGQRADGAERALLAWLLAGFAAPRTALEVGCGTGHFTRWLAGRGLFVVGLDRAPAMLRAARLHSPEAPLVLGDGHALPFPARSVDLVLFITTLEFLDDPDRALGDAVRVARAGVVVLALNRWSLGGLSRRWGPQRRRPLLGTARDYSLPGLRRGLARAAGPRLRHLRWSSALLPLFPTRRTAIPCGDVIAAAAHLA